jgi:hypothetical protein
MYLLISLFLSVAESLLTEGKEVKVDSNFWTIVPLLILASFILVGLAVYSCLGAATQLAFRDGRQGLIKLG